MLPNARTGHVAFSYIVNIGEKYLITPYLNSSNILLLVSNVVHKFALGANIFCAPFLVWPFELCVLCTILTAESSIYTTTQNSVHCICNSSGWNTSQTRWETAAKERRNHSFVEEQRIGMAPKGWWGCLIGALRARQPATKSRKWP